MPSQRGQAQLASTMPVRNALVTLVLACSAASVLAAGDDGQRTWVAGVPVSFQFATREEGHDLLLTNVHVVVRCPVAGKLFEGVSDGPFLVANLPDGHYDVVASHEGEARHLALSVARGEPRHVAIYW